MFYDRAGQIICSGCDGCWGCRGGVSERGEVEVCVWRWCEMHEEMVWYDGDVVCCVVYQVLEQKEW